MRVSDTGIGGGRDFPATSWSALLALRDPSSPEYARHLNKLVEVYWKPVYWAVRRGWRKDNQEAKDLTQEFFAQVLLGGRLVSAFSPERGSFRAFVRGALTNFLRTHTRDAGREKRGGGARLLSLDGLGIGDGTLEAPPSTNIGAATPEEVFDAAWNEVVMAEALRRLEARLAAQGKAAAFALFQRYDLDEERKKASYAELGAPLGLTGDQVKHALVHARANLREVVTEIVRAYVDGPEALAIELRALLG